MENRISLSDSCNHKFGELDDCPICIYAKKCKEAGSLSKNNIIRWIEQKKDKNIIVSFSPMDNRITLQDKNKDYDYIIIPEKILLNKKEMDEIKKALGLLNDIL
jgi:hypothetical protein